MVANKAVQTVNATICKVAVHRYSPTRSEVYSPMQISMEVGSKEGKC